MPSETPQPATPQHKTYRAPVRSSFSAWLQTAILIVAAILFALHFLHLNADFPNYSPWVDWSKYTDEGWYGDAAIRHYLTGHWYWKGDFNPAVALPVWPFLELFVFRFTGVHPAPARALTLCVFGLTLFTFYRLIARHTHPRTENSGPPLAASLAVLLLCSSPFFYVFERLAILEPLLIALTALALLAASHLHPFRPAKNPGAPGAASWTRVFALATYLPSIALGLLLPAMVLTKTTAIFLVPAVAYMVWARAGYRLRTAIRFSLLPSLMALGIWLAYFVLLVRPHYLDDYRYLFSANAYTGIELEPLSKVVLNTIADGLWMGHILFPLFFVILAFALLWKPRFFNNPLIPSLLLWTGGYFAFLAYHNNLQPRYYLVVAAPITVLVALGIDFFRQQLGSQPSAAQPLNTKPAPRLILTSVAAAAVVLAIVIPDTIQQFDFILHPDYTFQSAANGIKSIVLANPTHSHLILSISGSDLTLMTGLPSIDDDFGTLDLDQRVKQYHPGWYVAWNELDDDKMDALTPLYNVERVAAFPAMDDPDRNLLILYRLDPTLPTPETRTHKHHTPKPLVTKIGQQPSTSQLEH
jgi:hypothetical protein